MIRPILFLTAILVLFGMSRAFAGGGVDTTPICDELGADVLRAQGWKQFTPPDNDIMPVLVRQKKAELLNGTGEALTLVCRNPLYPDVKFMAVQRWYRRK